MQLQSPLQFTEEFDFEAMNEKFKKDEVWGYLGKANQNENTDGMQSATSGQKIGDDRQPAYNKDDFFDTISCHSVGRGTRDGQNRSSERVKLDSEVSICCISRRSIHGNVLVNAYISLFHSTDIWLFPKKKSVWLWWTARWIWSASWPVQLGKRI